MRYLFLLPAVYTAAVLETSLADVLRIGHVGPDLMALVAMIWLLLVPGPRAFLVAGAIGLCGDLISPGPPGPGLACFLLVGYAVAGLQGRVGVDHLAGRVAVVWMAVSVIATSLVLGAWLLGEAPASLATLLARALGVGLYTAGLSVPLWMIAGWIREPFRTPLAA